MDGGFVGRAAELEALRADLASPGLVTLTGLGGIGKTSLAREASSLTRGEVWTAALEAGTEPELALAGALGVGELPGGALTAAIERRLLASPALVVLDGCEHALEACASLCGRLVAVCPRLTILAASRRPLGVAGERIRHVGPLDAAVDLFLARAGPRFQTGPRDMEAVRRICERLDGIPLAVELAAARMRSVSAPDLAVRLDDPLRVVGALRAVLDWTCGMLTGSERELFAGLSVFVGGFTLDAAEAVCGGWILDDLTALVDNALVVAERTGDGIRYRMLDTVRDRAKAEATQASREAHAAWGRALAERAEPALSTGEQGAWMAVLAAEHDNLRAALGASSPCDALRTAVRLHRFWLLRGLLSEGRRWLEASLRDCTDDDLLAGLAQVAIGRLAAAQGDLGAAEAAAGAALGRQPADALVVLGNVAYSRGRLDEAAARYTDAAARHRSAGEIAGEAIAVHNLGLVAHERGDLDAAREAYERGLEIDRARGDRAGAAMALGNLAQVAFDAGDLDAARALCLQSLAAFEEAGASGSRLGTLHALAKVELRAGDLDAAAARVDDALALARELGNDRNLATVLQARALVAEGRGRLDAAMVDHEESLRLFEASIDASGIAIQALAVGRVALRSGDRRRARAALERAVTLADDLTPDDRAQVHVLLADLDLADGDRTAAQARLTGFETSGAVVRRAIIDGSMDALREALASAGPSDVPVALDGLASAAAVAGDHERAALLLGAADAAYGPAPPPSSVRPAAASASAAARAALGDEPFADARARGARMSAQEAVASAGRSVFRREGDLWVVVHNGVRLQLQDGKGLRYLARLLADPGRTFRATELADREERIADAPTDRTAILHELDEAREDLEDAGASRDPVRAERARERVDELTELLAVRRRGSGTTERARSAVSKAIRTAIRRIGDDHPELGKHLESSVRTGASCAYEPDVPVGWSV